MSKVSLFFGLFLSLSYAHAFSANRVESAFGCNDSQAVVTGTPTMNLYFADGAILRVTGTTTNQISLQGAQLILQSSDGGASVLTTLSTAPMCEVYEQGEVPPRYKASWNESDLGAGLTMTHTLIAQPATCKAVGQDRWVRTERVEIRITDAERPHTYLLLSSLDRAFATEADCKATP